MARNKSFKAVNSFFGVEKTLSSEKETDLVILKWKAELIRLHAQEDPGNNWSFKEVKLRGQRTEYHLYRNTENEGLSLVKFPAY